MKYLNKPVYYLQRDDFDDKGNLINTQIPRNKPTMIMIQATFCGHCNDAKPEYQQFANNMEDRVFCTTIQADGNEKGEKELQQLLNIIDPSFKGFPHYIVYNNGKRHTYQGQRTSKDLEKFISKI